MLVLYNSTFLEHVHVPSQCSLPMNIHNRKTLYSETLNSGHLRVLQNLSVIERCPLLGGNLRKIVIFRTKRFAHYSRHVRYLRCPLLGVFTAKIKSDRF